VGDVVTRTAGTISVAAPTEQTLRDLRLHGVGLAFLREPEHSMRELLGKLTGKSRAEIDALPLDDFVRLRDEAETLLKGLS